MLHPQQQPLKTGTGIILTPRDAPFLRQTRHKLNQMRDDYTFFSHAGLFEWAEFAVDPLADWCPQGARVFKDAVEQQIFHVFKNSTDVPGCSQPVPWNNVLFAVENSLWASLEGYVGGSVAVNHEKQAVYVPFWLPNNIFLGDSLEPVTVHAVGIHGPTTTYSPWHNQHFKPTATYQAFAKKVLEGNLQVIADKHNPVLKLPTT